MKIASSIHSPPYAVDLSDELLIAMSRNQGCHEFATFNTALAKRHAGFAFVPKD